jgi:hypothetical protein
VDCTEAIVAYLVSQFDPAMYDGVFFDRINQVITPIILDGIDLDHDGGVDGRDAVNDSYWRGTQRFLDRVREELGRKLGKTPVVVGNDAPLPYTPQLNGREYELQVRNILDEGKDWMRFRYNYEQWMQASLEPRLTMVMSNTPVRPGAISQDGRGHGGRGCRLLPAHALWAGHRTARRRPVQL